MNRKLWLLLFIAVGCSDRHKTSVSSHPVAQLAEIETSNPVEDTTFDAQLVCSAVAAWHGKHDGLSNLDQESDNNLQAITVFPVPDQPALCLAICDSVRQWWGFFGLYELKDGQVTWQAECPDQPTEQSIRWLRGLKLGGFSHPIIEAYGQTHMGNGYLYLYELDNQKLVRLLKTRAVDCHLGGDGQTLKNDRLMPEYPDLSGNGVADLLLTGEIEQHGRDDDKANENVVLSTHPCQKAFLWNPKTRQFEEDLSRRFGLSDEFE
jgi:hypothetical protein